MSKIFIFGLARSGTSWIASIFDSHPTTLLRFEPDIIHHDKELPFVFTTEEFKKYTKQSGKFGLELHNVKSLRANGKPPFFRKTYRNPLLRYARIALWYAAKGIAAVCGDRIARLLKIPDLSSQPDQVVSVVKSVDSPGRIAPMARALPDCKFIFIVRHPCGVVNSQLRGVELGKMGRNQAFLDWLKLDGAKSRDLDPETLQGYSQLEVNSWSWLLHNESIMERTSDLNNVYLLNYDALCQNLLEETEQLFKWCGLSMDNQVQDHLNESLQQDDAQKSYFSVIQQPSVASSKWKEQLPQEAQNYIKDLVRDSAPGRLFYKD